MHTHTFATVPVTRNGEISSREEFCVHLVHGCYLYGTGPITDYCLHFDIVSQSMSVPHTAKSRVVI